MGWKEKSIGYAICTPDAFICKRGFVVFAQIENINDSIISLLFKKYVLLSLYYYFFAIDDVQAALRSIESLSLQVVNVMDG